MRRLALTLAAVAAALLVLAAASFWLTATPVNRQLSVKLRPIIAYEDAYGRRVVPAPAHLEYQGSPLSRVGRDCRLTFTVSPKVPVKVRCYVYNVTVTYRGETKRLSLPSPCFPVYLALPINVEATFEDGSTESYDYTVTSAWLLGSTGERPYVDELLRAAIIAEQVEGGRWDPVADGLILCPRERVAAWFDDTYTFEVADTWGSDLWWFNWTRLRQWITYLLWARIEAIEGRRVSSLSWDFQDGEYGRIVLDASMDYDYYDSFAGEWSPPQQPYIHLGYIDVKCRSGCTVAAVSVSYEVERVVESYMVSPLLHPGLSLTVPPEGLAAARLITTLAASIAVGGLAAWRWRG